MHSRGVLLLSYQLYVRFLAGPYLQTHENYDVIVRCTGCLHTLFISNMGFFSWAGMEAEGGVRQKKRSDSKICDW